MQFLGNLSKKLENKAYFLCDLASYLGPCSGHAPEGPKIKHHEPMTSTQFKPPAVYQGREEAVTSPGLGSWSHNGQQWGSAPTLGTLISPGDSGQELRCSNDNVTPSLLQHRQNTFSYLTWVL